MGIAFEIMQGNQRFLMKCVLQAIYKTSVEYIAKALVRTMVSR